MKKIFIICTIFVIFGSCSKEYDKGKKGNFTFRKCSSCKVANN